MRKRKFKKTETILKASTKVKVRFSEVDALRIVWHGHYLKYFEDGREAFGQAYNLGYYDIYNHGYIAPIVSANCEYRRSLVYGDWVDVEIFLVPTLAAKIIFYYELYKSDTKELIAIGETTQVFMDQGGELELSVPSFFADWKKQWSIET